MNYDDFLKSKLPRVEACGIEPRYIHPMLFPFQRDVVTLGTRQGRFAGFEDPGLGKTFQQCEWTRQYQLADPSKPSLIVSPLSVAQQTIEEAKKIDIEVKFVSEPEPTGIQITNYQKLHRFVGHPYQSIALDESSILKSLDGKTRTLLLEEFTHIPYRSCWTGTPAPNDVVELLQHAEFLGIKTAREARSEFFVHDSKNGAVDGYRLKGHAVQKFWEWVAEWAIWIRRPSDLGYRDDGYILPELIIREEIVPVEFTPQAGTKLFPDIAKGIQGANVARKQSLQVRIERAREIIESSKDQWLVWCDLNMEGEGMSDVLESGSFGRGAVHIRGSSSDEDRILYERLWREGEVKTLITKAGMFGFGMNWQHAHKMIYLGLSHSYEKLKQSICRQWRFGQQHPVEVIIVVSEAEMSVVESVKRKMSQAEKMAEGIVKAMKEKQMGKISEGKAKKKKKKNVSLEINAAYSDTTRSPQWSIFNQDCVEGVQSLRSDSIGLSIFSPPFKKLYCYSDNPADMGNSGGDEEFFRHFGFLIPELLRVTIPGRLCVVHCQDMTTTKNTDGYIGRIRFSDQIADNFEKHGWITASRVTIDKNPQAQAIRTKAKTLMFVQKNKDSSWSWPALADYLMVFQKPGVNPNSVITDVSNEEWIKLAHPIWYDIDESDTLNARSAREEKDEAHLCPLQLGTIRNAIRLWSNRGDLILSPFAGIGSEGVVALEQERRFIGFELKESYWKQAVKNLKAAVKQENLFAEAGD